MRNSLRAAVALAFCLLCAGPSLSAETAIYVVQPGDTLYSLAKRYDTTVAALVEANGLDASYLIRVGQKLRVPGAEVKPAPTGSAPKATGSPAGFDGKGARVRSAEEAAALFHAGVERGAVIGRPPAPVASPAVPAARPAVQAAPPAAQTPPAAAAPAPATAAPAASGRVIEVTDEERLLLARLVMAEAGNEPALGQLGVAAVVVNRVRHPAFPKSVEAVVDEPGQFKSVELGRLANLVPDEAVLAVVDRALAGEDPTGGALFFYNPAKSVALDFWKTRPVTAVIGGHNFAR
ncbi:MAG: cell wall hydrolase [Chitinophagales bacterium]